MSETDPSIVPIEPELQREIQELLEPGEGVGEFVKIALTRELRSRRARRDFILQALAARVEAQASGAYVSTEDVLKGLEDTLRQHST